MRVIIGISAAILLLFCVSTAAIVEKRAVQSVLKGEKAFVKSLELDQQKWWDENRQKVFNLLVNKATDISGDSDLDEETIQEVIDFIESLNPTQQKLWLKLKSKANKVVTKYLASARTYQPTIQLSRRAVCGGGCIFSKQCRNWVWQWRLSMLMVFVSPILKIC